MVPRDWLLHRSEMTRPPLAPRDSEKSLPVCYRGVGKSHQFVPPAQQFYCVNARLLLLYMISDHMLCTVVHPEPVQ